MKHIPTPIAKTDWPIAEDIIAEGTLDFFKLLKDIDIEELPYSLTRELKRFSDLFKNSNEKNILRIPGNICIEVEGDLVLNGKNVGFNCATDEAGNILKISHVPYSQRPISQKILGSLYSSTKKKCNCKGHRHG